jgi:hypothetical protein
VPWYRPLSRFDTGVLQALPASISPRAVASDQQADALARLKTWCLAGAGPARAPWWRPWALPSIEQRLSVMVWAGEGTPVLWPVAQDFCRDIDGSQRLQALPSRWTGWAWRLRIKLFECAWWWGATAHLPWDAGQAMADPVALARWALFRPRRACLIVARDLTFDQTEKILGHLQTQSPRYAHAVRLLLVTPRWPVAAPAVIVPVTVTVTVTRWPQAAI